MTSRQKAREKAEAIGALHDYLKDGDTVHITLRYRSAYGMMRVYDVYKVEGGELLRLSWYAAYATGRRYNKLHDGVEVGGCGFSGSQQICDHMRYELGFEVLTCREF